MSSRSWIIVGILALIVVLAVIFVIYSGSKPVANSTALDSFAKCLSQKGFTMYGLYSCPHCQEEKALFGDSFQYVNYVECSSNPDECTAKNVNAVPTWIGPDGKTYVGTQSLQNLASVSGCTLPAGSK
ncbi:hypothetical protein M1295_00045 [Patescibacteria group bacterium]|nr:hypothetical protein [Patescibacteria group bacterium]